MGSFRGRFFFQAEDGIRGGHVTGVQTCALPISTGADGSFHLTQLPAGQYGLTATATGFKTSNQSIELKPSEMAMLQPVLDVGSVSARSEERRVGKEWRCRWWP